VKLNSFPKSVQLAVHAAQEKKAGAITVLDLSGLGAFTEYFVICTAYSSPQSKAVCEEVEESLYKNAHRSPAHREGQRTAEWALVDFGGFVLHVFSEQARRYYDLERLWRDAPKLEIPDEPESLAHDNPARRAAGESSHFPDEAVS
jgi:ribosome-associated protein